ncbi:LruC domain-containing protein [Mucilaginibacter aquatilis]|uniref:LruC domain-containing protein n=1 Tax=Mucilaginibacter aquatilis TaxID=1517760 RepID=A0A6I4I3M4_9SPHI|nr:LruC domain-containing protein [Mucilaginibacter aquatilis]MVN89725.1 LruC domain-containing protein [Mucilaginibacter aquatilis]
MKHLFTCALLAGVVSFSACKKDASQPEETTTNPVAGAKIAPDGFNFSTTKNVTLNVTLRAANNEALAGVVVSAYLPGATSPIFKGVTDKSGVLQGLVTIPTSVNKLIIDPAYVGLMRNAQAAISTSNTVTALIGGKDGFGGDIQPEEITVSTSNGTTATKGTMAIGGPVFAYPSPYTSSTNATFNTTQYPRSVGRPVYLEATPDAIDASLLSYINASLPEGSPLPTTHPEFLTTNAVSNLNITATSDVWITFVSEGAGYLNTLAYYTYPTNTPPTSVDDLDNATLIFPNASANGSGGALKPGDKVKIGRFNAGTSIGFVLIQNAWNGSGVLTGNAKFYSDYRLNPESTVAKKKHVVTLWDDVHKLFLMGFEDINRDNGSDQDFNDLVVYATSNPVTGISNSGVPAIDKGGDTDGDGVLDELDAFPDDATKAYVSYYPSQTGYASIAFEDNWPKKGDFDLNDLVVNYRYTFVSNASNQVVEMKGEFTPLASGASFKNGFAVQLPVSASAVSAVTGQRNISNYISYAANGVEAGQSKAVIVPFDNHEALLRNPDGAFFINTLMDKNKVTGSTATVNVTFASPVAASNLQVANFNPFLISDMRRGYEIHLPGFAPTDKATKSLFGTDDDASVLNSNKTYLSKENWPWAISFVGEYKYPVELQPVNQAYLRFSEWALSGGTSYADWYSNTGVGFRDASKIYSK